MRKNHRVYEGVGLRATQIIRGAQKTVYRRTDHINTKESSTASVNLNIKLLGGVRVLVTLPTFQIIGST